MGTCLQPGLLARSASPYWATHSRLFFTQVLFIVGPCTGGGPDVEASNVG